MSKLTRRKIKLHQAEEKLNKVSKRSKEFHLRFDRIQKGKRYKTTVRIERGTDFAAERVHALIDYRISTGKPLIITTNIELSEMRETTDIRKKRTYDRIFNACFPIAFHGTSFRQKQARDNFMMMNELLNEDV